MNIESCSMQWSFYRLLRDSLDYAGIDSAALLEKHGLDGEGSKSASACVLSDRLNQVWVEAESVSRNAAIGLAIPEHAAYGLGAVTPLVLSAESVRESLRSIAKNVHLISPTLSMRLLTQESNFYVELAINAGTQKVVPQRYDFVASALLQHIRSLTGCSFKLKEFHRPGARPKNIEPWEAAFNCRINSGAARCVMVMPASEVDQSIHSSDAVLHDFCEKLASRREDLRFQTLSLHVRGTLERLVARGEPRREDVAGELGISVRSLSRRLAREGTSFARIVNDVRRELAEQYLNSNEYNLNEITYALGFGDPSNFYRACKRWFGCSPRVVRDAKLKEAGMSMPPAIQDGGDGIRSFR